MNTDQLEGVLRAVAFGQPGELPREHADVGDPVEHSSTVDDRKGEEPVLEEHLRGVPDRRMGRKRDRVRNHQGFQPLVLSGHEQPTRGNDTDEPAFFVHDVEVDDPFPERLRAQRRERFRNRVAGQQRREVPAQVCEEGFVEMLVAERRAVGSHAVCLFLRTSAPAGQRRELIPVEIGRHALHLFLRLGPPLHVVGGLLDRAELLGLMSEDTQEGPQHGDLRHGSGNPSLVNHRQHAAGTLEEGLGHGVRVGGGADSTLRRSHHVLHGLGDTAVIRAGGKRAEAVLLGQDSLEGAALVDHEGRVFGVPFELAHRVEQRK